MTEDQYNEIVDRAESGGTITEQELKGCVDWMIYEGLDIYCGEGSRDWLLTVQALLKAAGI